MLFSDRSMSLMWTFVICALLVIGFSVEKAESQRNCKDVQRRGYSANGVYTIYPRSSSCTCACAQIHVYCDMTTDGGGWTVFQRRLDGSEDFYRGWKMYQNGFGSVAREHWLGLSCLHVLTAQSPNELRVDMSDFDGNDRYARYSEFFVGDNTTGYQLAVSGYSGDAGNCIGGRDGMRFSTFDHDQDTATYNCAVSYHGAWWYEKCHCANPNGNYHGGNHTTHADGVNWHRFKGHYYSLKIIDFKIHPL